MLHRLGDREIQARVGREHPAVEPQADRLPGRFAEVEGEGPRFGGVALVARALVAVGVDLVPGPDPPGHVAAAAIGGVDYRADSGAGHHCVGRAADVPLARHDPQVAGYRHALPVIDHPEPRAVEVGGLPQLLGDPQVVEAVARGGAVDPDQLVGVVAVPDPVRQGHAQRGAPQQVGDEGDLVAVPGVEERATALEHLLFDDGQVPARRQAVLRHAVGPDDADQIGLPAVAEADVGDLAVDLEVLVRPARLDLDRRAAAEDVVLLARHVETDQANPQPVVLRAVQVLDPVEAGTARGDEVLVAVVVEVVGADGRELRVAGQAGDAGEAEVERLRAGIRRLGEHPQFAIGDQGEIEPAVVVRVEQGEVGGAFRQCGRTGAEGEGRHRPVLIALQDDRRIAGEQELGHPVAVEVGGSYDPHRRSCGQGARCRLVGAHEADQPPEQTAAGRGRGSLREPALPEIVQPQDALVVREQQVRVAVAVGVGGLEVVVPARLDFGQRLPPQGLKGALEHFLARHVPQQIGHAVRPGHREVEVAVAVEIDQVGRGCGQRARQETVARVPELRRVVELPDGQGIADRDQVEAPVVVGVADHEDLGAGLGGGARCGVSGCRPPQLKACPRTIRAAGARHAGHVGPVVAVEVGDFEGPARGGCVVDPGGPEAGGTCGAEVLAWLLVFEALHGNAPDVRVDLGQAAVPAGGFEQDVPDPGSKAAGALQVVRLQRVEYLPEHPLGDRPGLPDQLPHPQVVVACPAAVAVRKRLGAAQEQDDQVVGPQAPQPVHRVPPIGFGLVTGHDLGVPEERVLRLGIVGRCAGGAAIVRERILVAAVRPSQDFGADEQQVGPVAAQFQGPVDRRQRLLVPVLAQQGYAQVGVAEGFVRQQFDQAAIGAFGLRRLFVLELGVAEVPQAHHLFGRLRARGAGGGERGENENGWEFAEHGL